MRKLLLILGAAATLFPAILVPAFIAELSLALWLPLKAVDTRKWNGLSTV
jgi:hypothetical protein